MTHRPTSWSDYIGQESLKDRLQLHIQSSLERGVNLPHVLLVSGPGMGKTTLASIISNEMGQPFENFIMPLKPRILERVVKNQEGVVLFDEIHRSNPRQQESLLTFIEDNYYLDDRGNRWDNNNLTVVAATTEGDKIIRPLYERFKNAGILPTFDPYTQQEIMQIISNGMKKEMLYMNEVDLELLAKASLGVPRNVNGFISVARDLFYQNGNSPSALEILDALRITETGLSVEHIRYLKNLLAAGGQAGLELMQMMLSIPEGAIVQLEIDLIRQGLIERQARGREITALGARLARDVEV